MLQDADKVQYDCPECEAPLVINSQGDLVCSECTFTEQDAIDDQANIEANDMDITVN